MDLCGQCLDPKDPGFNAGCFKVQSVVPSAAGTGSGENHEGGEEIVVTGSGFKGSMICQFVDTKDSGAQFTATMGSFLLLIFKY